MTTVHSDGRDPQLLTKQVLSIYPILSGQKASDSNGIPTRPAEDHPADSEAAPTPAPTPAPATATLTRDDLVDFSADNASVEPPQPQRPAAVVNSAVESTGEISGLLKATGKPADGPLLNLTHA